MAQRPKCRHCETAIVLKEGIPNVWMHIWSYDTECRKMINKKPLGTYAEPRPDK